MVADSIVQFGEEESRGATDVGGKKDVAFFTFLGRISTVRSKRSRATYIELS
jgi:hypothetical protein